jgi:hypothetical protein
LIGRKFTSKVFEMHGISKTFLSGQRSAHGGKAEAGLPQRDPIKWTPFFGKIELEGKCRSGSFS